MDEDLSKASADSEAEASATYEKWKFFGSAYPFRWAFTGLFILAAGGAIEVEKAWDTPYRSLAVGAGLLFLFGLLSLFHDIPRRRLGRVSKVFLSLGIAVLIVLVGLMIFRRLGA